GQWTGIFPGDERNLALATRLRRARAGSILASADSLCGGRALYAFQRPAFARSGQGGGGAERDGSRAGAARLAQAGWGLSQGVAVVAHARQRGIRDAKTRGGWGGSGWAL